MIGKAIVDERGNILEINLTLSDYGSRPVIAPTDSTYRLITLSPEQCASLGLAPATKILNDGSTQEEKYCTLHGEVHYCPELEDASNEGELLIDFPHLSLEKRKSILDRVDPSLLRPFMRPRTNEPFLRMPERSPKKFVCEYGTTKLKCSKLAKNRYIYCGHHLKVASNKYQAQKALKRSRSSSDNLDGSEEPDYSGLDPAPSTTKRSLFNGSP